MFELRAVPHSVTPGVTVFEIWENETRRGVIYPSETGIRIFSKFLQPGPSNRIMTHLDGQNTNISINLQCLPYFPGQKPASCGHFYPDVIRVKDKFPWESAKNEFERVFRCVVCGEYTQAISTDQSILTSLCRHCRHNLTDPASFTEEWREAERKRLREQNHE